FEPGVNTFLDLVHPDDVAIFRDKHTEASPPNTRRSIKQELRARRTDGTNIWVTLSSIIEHGPAGTPVRSTGLIQATPADRTAAAALAESERKFRLLADNIVDVITVYDETGKFTYISPSSEDMTGYKPEELLGKDIFSISVVEDASAIHERRSRM